ncbi:hypothetical protein BCE_A0204 (plasmid) [Bacillus cereus ATCC 10987]|uniref:Uncharacterized protein n=1 Tax=Bacillus cereus (strain ATCC 10987 / NRS 248) TaxID=222523 RepID=Q74NP0_BACC1|nr:hypothetical protein BCE_A0204 [Bacillus cereus ATCC 10987]
MFIFLTILLLLPTVDKQSTMVIFILTAYLYTP